MMEDKLTEIKSKLPTMYFDFMQNYVSWQMHPTNIDNKRAFENIKLNLQSEEHNLRNLNDEINHIQRELKKDHVVALFENTGKAPYNASKTRIDDVHTLYVQSWQHNIFLGVGVLLLLGFILNAGSYQLAMPPIGGGLGAFAVYLIILVLYVYYYGSSGYLFVIMIIPFFIFASALFINSKPTPGTSGQ
jgi:hypothetical protein